MASRRMDREMNGSKSSQPRKTRAEKEIGGERGAKANSTPRGRKMLMVRFTDGSPKENKAAFKYNAGDKNGIQHLDYSHSENRRKAYAKAFSKKGK